MPRKHKLRASWGDLLGGEPIERVAPKTGPLGDHAEKIARAEQAARALRIMKEHLGIQGETGRDFYEAFVRLAGELDPAMTIVDPPTSNAVWCGGHGLALIRHVELLNEELGGDEKQEALFASLKADVPETHIYAMMSEAALKTAHHTACRHFSKDTVFQQRKRKSTG